MSPEPRCSRCRHRKPQWICGVAEGPYAGRKIEPNHSCEEFDLNPACDELTFGLQAFLAEEKEAALRHLTDAIHRDLPQDDEVQARAWLGCTMLQLRQGRSPDWSINAFAQIEWSVAQDLDKRFGFFDQLVNRQAILEPLQFGYSEFGLGLLEAEGPEAAKSFFTGKLPLFDRLPGDNMLVVHFALAHCYLQGGDQSRANEHLLKAANSEPLGDESAEFRHMARAALDA